MPIYYGTQKVSPSGISTAYYGTQKIYTATSIDLTLENNTWEAIKTAINNGLAPSAWLGQTKEITSGTYAGYHFRLVDLTSNRYEKTGGGYSKAVFQFAEVLPGTIKMNSTDTNAGGYANSSAKTSVNNIFNDLPSDIQTVISEVVIQTSAGSSNPNQLVGSYCKLFLLAERELFNQTYYSYSVEQFTQYQYYAQDTNNIKLYDIGNIGRSYWGRSPRALAGYFCGVWFWQGDAGYNADLASANYYISPAFAI